MTNQGLRALILTVILASSAAPAMAQLSYDQAVAYCKSLGEIAGTIMENRQLGVGKDEQLATMAAMDNEHWQQLGIKLVEVAYASEPRIDADAQTRVAQEFRSEYERACYKMYID